MKDIVSIILFHKVDLSVMSEKTQKTCVLIYIVLTLSPENIKSSVTLHQPSRDATVVKLRCGQIY